MHFVFVAVLGLSYFARSVLCLNNFGSGSSEVKFIIVGISEFLTTPEIFIIKYNVYVVYNV